jgi:adenosylcobinamide-GDP ribazoletransferase
MDGLSDTFDGLAIKGTGDVEQDRQARLSVMREGKQGPIGCTSIVLDLLLKYALCKELLGRGRLSPLFLAPVGSRFAMVLCCFIGRPARKEGLGVLFIGRKKKRNMLLSLLFTIGLFLLGRPCFSLSSILFLGISFLFLMFLLVRLFESRFGGLTGDTLGAINELSELLFLAFFLT